MNFRKFLAILLSAVTLTACASGGSSNPSGAGDSLDFFKSLNYDDGMSVLLSVLERYPLQYGATLGTDGAPQLRPIEFKFEEDGVLYFDTVVFYSTYTELLQYPYIQLCVADPETESYIRLGGKVNFTKDEDIIDRCFKESATLTSQFGNMREFVIAYYLTDVWMEFSSFAEELPQRTYTLPNKFDEQE